MKKIVLSIMSALVLFANEGNLNYTEQKELLQTLESQNKKDQSKGAYELGLLYEDGILNSKNVKVPDMEKATRYYIMAFENKDYRCTYKIVNLLLEKKEYKKALEILQKVIQDAPQNRSLLISTVTTYGTIVLDYLPNDKNLVADALYNFTYLTKDELNKVATSKFIKAVLLANMGNISEGEKLLNEACYSPNAPKELKDKCFDKNNFDLVKEGTNGKKSINEPCCTLLNQ